MKFPAIVAFLFVFAAPVLSTVYITNPVSSTTVDGGKKLRIHWQDSSVSPKVSAWQGINIWLAAGSESSQYKLDQIAKDLSTSRTSISYKVPKNIGPKGKYYFIRMESTKTAPNGTAIAMSFSARFSLHDVTGTFNSTVLAAAHGKEGTPSTSPPSSASGMTTSSSSANPNANSNSNTTSSASSSLAKSSSDSTSGAADCFVAKSAVTAGLGVSIIAAGAVAFL